MDASFFLVISFSSFAYIFYKKLWPSFLGQIDEYIANIKTAIQGKKSMIKQLEKIKVNNKKQLDEISEEVEKMQETSAKQLQLLITSLEAELTQKYQFHQRNFQQTLERSKHHQHHILQSKFVDAVFLRVEGILQGDPQLKKSYMTNAVIKITEEIKDIL